MMKYYVFFLTLTSSIIKCHAELITFDPPPLPDGSRLESNYEESGIRFSGYFGHGSTSRNGRASNDSTGYLSIGTPGWLQISMVNSNLFNLESIDLSEYSTVFAGQQKTVSFTGFYSDGSSTTESFTTDGLIDSIGGVDDFETFSFSDNFSNLTYVEVLTTGFAFDDIVITAAVPEPSSMALLLGGILLLRRRIG